MTKIVSKKLYVSPDVAEMKINTECGVAVSSGDEPVNDTGLLPYYELVEW